MADKSEAADVITKVSLFEQHFQEGLMLCIVALLGWTLYTVNEASIKLATLTERVAALQAQVEQSNALRYTIGDATRDLQLRDQRLQDLSDRVRGLETGHK